MSSNNIIHTTGFVVQKYGDNQAGFFLNVFEPAVFEEEVFEF